MPRNGVGTPYFDFITQNSRAIIAHLYQFTSVCGESDYFTDLDQNIIYNSILWKASSLRIDGMRRKTAVGLQVDEQSLNVFALPSDQIFGANFLTAVEEGILDGCQITRFRAIWAVDTGNLSYDVANNDPIQVFTMFTGFASKVEKGGQTKIEMKVKSPLVKLELNMPRNYYQPGCLWTLFDTGCTLNQGFFSVNGVVDTSPTPIQIPVVGGIATPVGADNIPTYAQGKILFTSGVNNGLLTLINTNDSAILYLAYPLNAVASSADTFTFWPGCSKSFNTCDVKFNNKANYRGFDKVPPISISI